MRGLLLVVLAASASWPGLVGTDRLTGPSITAFIDAKLRRD